MNLVFRVIAVLLAAIARQRRGEVMPALAPSILHLRVWPNDLDVNLHMNNGRYLTVMDLGRMDLVIRTGLWRPLLRRRWTALLGGATIRYKRPLAPFARYRLETRVLGWDDKWFLLEQTFRQGETLVAFALVRALFRGRAGNVPPETALRAAGITLTSPELPAAAQTWARWEEETAERLST